MLRDLFASEEDYQAYLQAEAEAEAEKSATALDPYLAFFEDVSRQLEEEKTEIVETGC